ncbi:hypothetical protein Scep_004433 [Stephania cephalantha]|uniref:Uncharacterized protein n=1 Tax=Stephania cephalantha TaxID=152367 RepID=A0AAP0KVB1_9MAGN
MFVTCSVLSCYICIIFNIIYCINGFLGSCAVKISFGMIEMVLGLIGILWS